LSSFTLAFASQVAAVDQVVANLPGQLGILDSPMPRRFGTRASLLLVQASNGITVVPVALPLAILLVHDGVHGLLNGHVPHPGLLWRMTLESPTGLTLTFLPRTIVELKDGTLERKLDGSVFVAAVPKLGHLTSRDQIQHVRDSNKASRQCEANHFAWFGEVDLALHGRQCFFNIVSFVQ
jgi:hypothetical protein